MRGAMTVAALCSLYRAGLNPDVVRKIIEFVPWPPRMFMLHHPETREPLKKFTATDFKSAAMMAARRGHTDIHLREACTTEVRAFEGRIHETAAGKKVPKVKLRHKFAFGQQDK